MPGRLKIELIVPGCSDNAPLPNLAAGIIAALTPPEVEISYTDDEYQPLDLNGGPLKSADLVGITVSSQAVPRAYAIADAYRRQGTPVVLGGIHPTAMPEEAREHCDSVVVGEAEGVWGKLLADFRRGNLEPFYKQEHFTPPETIPVARRELYNRKHYFPLSTVQATRGCPYSCDFCSVRKFLGSAYRCRPVPAVLDEVRTLPHKTVLFADDDIVGHPQYTRELLDGLRPLGKRWMSQASLAGLKDEEQVVRLRKSGCLGLFIGFESILEENIQACGKKQNHPSDYRRIVDCLHRHGISVWASFLFGLDHDDPGIFERAVRFAIEAKFMSVGFAIVTPYPKTDFYERLKIEGRLTDESWWLKADQSARAPHFHPRGMTREQLREGWKWAWQEFYSYSSIARRFQWNYRPTVVNRLIYFPFNVVQHRFVKRKIVKGERLRWSKLPFRRASARRAGETGRAT